MQVEELDLHGPAGSHLAAALVRLQRAAYAVEARLIGHDGIPQLAESAEALRAAGLSWLAVLDGTTPVAALAYSHEGDVLDVERLVVDPARFRQGLARVLVSALPPAPVTVVATGRDNTPARALYAGLGFEPRGDEEVAPGLWITRLERRRSPGPGTPAPGGAGSPAER